MTRSAPSRRALGDRELADRAGAPDGDHLAGLDVAHLRAHVAGREDVGEEQHLLVGEAVGTLSGPTSANGTRAYSACPPAKPPVMCE